MQRNPNIDSLQRTQKTGKHLLSYLLSNVKNVFGRYSLWFLPYADVKISSDPNIFESNGEGPQILVLSKSGNFPAGLVSLSLQMKLPVKSKTSCRLYYDIGNGFSEQDPILINLIDKDQFSARFLLPKNVKALRLDIYDCVGGINLRQFSIRKITKVELLSNFIKSRNIRTSKDFLTAAKKGFNILRTQGLSGIKQRLRTRVDENYNTWIEKYDSVDRETIKMGLSTFSYKPLISIVLPTYNTQEVWLRAAIESVQAQLYDNWELCIADDFSTDENVRRVIQEYASTDSHIKFVFREKNGHISASSNSALSLASGEFVAFLDHDDTLAETALYRIIQGLNQKPNSDVIFSDEDKIDENGRRFDPYFKPNWMPDLFNTQNCVTHLVVYRKKIIDSVGGFRVGYEGAQDWDLMMRISEIIPAENILHLPYILYHWRAIPGSTAKAKNEKSYIEESQKRTIQDHFTRTNTPVEVTPHFNDFWKIKYLIDGDLPSVSIIIPTRNQVELLRCCIDSIRKKTIYKNYEILIVDNSSDEPEMLTYLNEMVKANLARVLYYPKAFNYSAINNFAVNNSTADVVVLLNNDTEVISPDWLDEMVSLAIRPFTGAVGAKLYYPDNTIQHAGVILGIGGVAGHAYWHQPRSAPGQMARAMLTQNYSAVTGACLAVERKKFLEVGGLNEEELKIALSDIDFCLKLLDRGYLNVWTPHAELYHYESASRGYEDTPEKLERFDNERLFMMAKWGPLLQNDPAYNPNLTLERADFGLAFPPRTPLP